MPCEEWLRERRQAHRLARRLIAFLKDAWEWEIRFMPLQSDAGLRKRLGFGRVIVGCVIWDKNVIIIDPSYEDYLGVLIHEVLHCVLPETEEADILQHERIVRLHLTPGQASALVYQSARRLR